MDQSKRMHSRLCKSYRFLCIVEAGFSGLEVRKGRVSDGTLYETFIVCEDLLSRLLFLFPIQRFVEVLK